MQMQYASRQIDGQLVTNTFHEAMSGASATEMKPIFSAFASFGSRQVCARVYIPPGVRMRV